MTYDATYSARRPARRLSTRRKLGLSKAGVAGAVISIALSLIGSLFSPDPEPVIEAGLLLALIFLATWQENEPPLLFFPAFYQWIAVATKPLMTVFLHTPVNALAEYPIDLKPGIHLGVASVAALTIGMRLALGRPKHDWNAVLRNEAQMVTRVSILTVSIGAVLFGHFLLIMSRYTAQLNQLLFTLANIRFLGLFALAYWCFSNRRGYAYLAAVSLVEILIGITGFFSEFRAPIFVVAFAALAVGHRPKVRDMLMAAVLAVALIVLGAFWSNIKSDYREFVSGGTNEQQITVSLGERLDYLGTQVQQFDRSRFEDGFNRLMNRQSYIDFLSATMSYVPQSLPYEHGARLGSAVLSVITPRVFFPDKAATEFDSDVTAKYTGLPIQVKAQTSISIGFVGELYIDFGSVGAVIGCLVMGLAFGAAYRFIQQSGHGSVMLNYGARSILIVMLMSFETALIKYVGGVGIAFVGAFLLQRFAVPILTRHLRIRAAPRRPPQPLGAT